MLDQQTILTKLKTVKDPELQHNIVDLHMVRGINLEASGQVSVEIALTVAGCPLHEQIETEVRQALLDLPDVNQVSVHLSVMDAAERKQAFSAAFGSRTAPTATRPTPSIGPLAGQAKIQGLANSQTSMVAVASGKGGVGKSTVTANLAVALSRLGFRVGLMDLDIYGFSQGRLFGASGGATSDDQDKIRPWNYHGVSLVSMGMFVREDQAVIWRGPMLGKTMDQFFQDVVWPELDFLLIDLPPGTGDVALNIAQKLPNAQLVLVTTPQAVATHVAHRAAEVATRARQRIVGVIENMSYLICPHGEVLRIFGEGGGQSLADELQVPLLGQIPIEPEVRQGSDLGTPVASQTKLGEAGQVFLAVAQEIVRAVGR